MGTSIPWMRPGWPAQAHAWIRAELTRRGIQVSGPIEQPHVRPWSTVLRVPTSSGACYFKASAPALAHEPALTEFLWRRRPDCMPRVLATDPARGWMLTADAGVMLRDLIRSSADLCHWQKVLPLYAEVQIEMTSRVNELLTLGALDRRLITLPARYEQLLADEETLRLGQSDGVTVDEYRRLRAMMPQVAAVCEQLAGYGLPETLHHDDFHDGNVFVQDGRYILTDWGESCLAHPFFTLLVCFRSTAYRVGLKMDAPEFAQLRDAYLEPWTRYAPPGQLRTGCALAQRPAMVCRILTWHRIVSGLDGAFREEYAGAVPGWLRELLAAESPVAG